MTYLEAVTDQEVASVTYLQAVTDQEVSGCVVLEPQRPSGANVRLGTPGSHCVPSGGRPVSIRDPHMSGTVDHGDRGVPGAMCDILGPMHEVLEEARDGVVP